MTTSPARRAPATRRLRRRAGPAAGAFALGALALGGCHLGKEPALYPLGDTGTFLADLAVGDLDGDEDVDVVATLWTGYAVGINDGTGAFDVTRVSSPLVRGGRAALADVDGDGHADLVHHAANGTFVDVRLGDGAGRFHGDRTVIAAPDRLDTGVAVDDLDGDGDGDIVAAGRGGLTVWANEGDGSFGTPTVVELAQRADSLAVDDMDGDGAPDLVVATQSTADNAVLVAYGDGEGGFAEPRAFGTDLPEETRRIYLATGDLDGDGSPDVFGGNSATSDVFVLTSNGAGGFDTSATYDGVGTSAGVTAADVDGDGHLDVVTDLAVLYNDGRGNLVDAYEVAGGQRVVSADFDGNGQPDLASLTADALNVLLNELNGRRRPDTPLPLPTRPS